MSIVYPFITEENLIPVTIAELPTPVVVSGTSPSFVTTIFIPPQKFNNLPNGRYDLYFVANVTGSSANITGSIGIPGVFEAQFPYRDPLGGGPSISARRPTGFDLAYDSNDYSDFTPTYLGLSAPIYASGSAADVTCSIYQVYMMKKT